MIDFLIFLHLYAGLLVQEPIYTIVFSLGALLFVKWLFYAHPEDDEDIVNIGQYRNIQVKPLKTPTIDVDAREYKYAQTTPSELIQLKQNKEKLKILDDKILYSKRKIDIMKENGVIGAIIDNIAGNSIADEQAKIVELEKQKNLRLYKYLQNDCVATRCPI